jgi:hypothetical protein
LTGVVVPKTAEPNKPLIETKRDKTVTAFVGAAYGNVTDTRFYFTRKNILRKTGSIIREDRRINFEALHKLLM